MTPPPIKCEAGGNFEYSARTSTLETSEEQQQKHYNTIAADYDVHYSDQSSRDYRLRFIYQPMFAGIELAGAIILDAMCGSGQTTEYLLEQGASVTGLDISNEVLDTFQARWPDAYAVHRSLLDSKLPNHSFDCVAVVGGLHHIHPNVNQAVNEVHRLLRPGGHFCFMEPHSGSLPNFIRRFWYRYDPLFSRNEAAIDLEELKNLFSSKFEFKSVIYQGNIAFLLVLNSMIFRIPARWKPRYSQILMRLESVISKLQGKRSACFVVAQWQKKS